MLQFYTFLLRQPAKNNTQHTTYNIINNLRNSIKIFLSKAPIYNRKSNTQRNENETVPLKKLKKILLSVLKLYSLYFLLHFVC